ncbi:CRISPR-associated helicase Cas3' [Tissierella pigra]|uniref:CRISPR-associated helicase Cas3' n=1 Tax=Tissierella pigra TaxID=2607614 RepID=UPI001C104CE6|nr:CRISPR-associated helicase Cas3' [Tissierella pigra]MBU5425327.1 CRISPR-associated helicase Cas3' [Tissierella pigra]
MYYAKPIEGYLGSYEYHVKKCVEIFHGELSRNREALTNIMDSINHNMDFFERNSYLAISMHDIGKLSYMFQDQMEKIINGEKGFSFFRHELLSAVYMIVATQKYIKENSGDFPYHYYAVLSHHKKLNINLDEFDRERDRIEKWPELTEEEYHYGLNLVMELSKKELNLVDSIGSYKIKKETILKYFESRMQESFLVKLELGKSDIRMLYSICKGLLQYCDWIGSSDKEPLQQTLTQDELIEKIKYKVEAEGNHYIERIFHKECATAREDVVAIAPTGAGKTEASLLWAIKSEKAKVIFLMPTMVTSNSIFSRLIKSYFRSEYCGLTHSSSDVYFAINDEFKTKDSSKLRFELLQYKAFIPPVMVSTIDQLLTSGFNLGYWSLKEYALVGSSIIFDEIQAYDTFTLGLITETIKKIKKLQGRVMIMSATMPKFLLNHFSELLEIKSPIIATELMERRHNKWKFIDNQLEEIIDEIKSYIYKKKKVAVIVNNIERAKQIYEDMSKEFNALCLHSEFTMEDRMEKEKLLEEDNDYEIVISTQVMEVSLDISFNIMFSECAPIDSLVQRAGRCNRRGEYDDSEFIVFDYSETSEKYVYRRHTDVLKKSKEVVQKNQKYLSEYEISDMVNEVYAEFNMYDNNYDEAIKLYSRIEEEEIIFDLGYDEDKFKTRLINNTKISIIPYDFKEVVEELFENQEYAKISLYEVPVSIGRFNKYILINYCENKYNLPIYTVNYNSDIGIIYNDNTFDMI